ncbi:MAG: class I SAM-dependent methyltransferase [Caldilineaceae bacterium]
MRDSGFEYWGKMAELWDFFRGDTSQWPDRRFYLELIAKEGQPVLDVGCGTGRLLLDYMQQGVDVDGVDNSPDMLTLAQRKGAALGLQPRLFTQKVETLDLPRKYQVILIPSSSIQLVTDPTMAAAAMRRLYDHMLPGGAIAGSIMTFWREGEPLVQEWQLAAERIRESDGVLLRRWSRSVYDPSTECESTEDRYEALVDGVVVESETHSQSPATRNYTQAQAQQLYAQAGFSAISLHSEFTWEPAKPSDTLFTVVARRAG